VRVRTAQVVDGLIVAGASVVVALKEADAPRSLGAHFDANGWQLVAIVSVGGFFGAFGPLQAWARRASLTRRVQLYRAILSKLGALIEMACKAVPGLPIADPGLHIWRPRRSLRHPVRGELERVGFFRLGDSPTTRSFGPRRGVGVIGLCWRDNAPKSFDVTALATRLRTAADFNAQRTEDRDVVMNFSWAEFQRVKHRGAVFAAPIRGRADRCIGCVSIDVSRGYTALSALDVEALLAGVARLFSAEDFDLLS